MANRRKGVDPSDRVRSILEDMLAPMIKANQLADELDGKNIKMKASIDIAEIEKANETIDDLLLGLNQLSNYKSRTKFFQSIENATEEVKKNWNDLIKLINSTDIDRSKGLEGLFENDKIKKAALDVYKYSNALTALGGDASKISKQISEFVEQISKLQNKDGKNTYTASAGYLYDVDSFKQIFDILKKLQSLGSSFAEGDIFEQIGLKVGNFKPVENAIQDLLDISLQYDYVQKQIASNASSSYDQQTSSIENTTRAIERLTREQVKLEALSKHKQGRIYDDSEVDYYFDYSISNIQRYSEALDELKQRQQSALNGAVYYQNLYADSGGSDSDYFDEMNQSMQNYAKYTSQVEYVQEQLNKAVKNYDPSQITGGNATDQWIVLITLIKEAAEKIKALSDAIGDVGSDENFKPLLSSIEDIKNAFAGVVEEIQNLQSALSNITIEQSTNYNIDNSGKGAKAELQLEEYLNKTMQRYENEYKKFFSDKRLSSDLLFASLASSKTLMQRTGEHNVTQDYFEDLYGQASITKIQDPKTKIMRIIDFLEAIDVVLKDNADAIGESWDALNAINKTVRSTRTKGSFTASLNKKIRDFQKEETEDTKGAIDEALNGDDLMEEQASLAKVASLLEQINNLLNDIADNTITLKVDIEGIEDLKTNLTSIGELLNKTITNAIGNQETDFSKYFNLKDTEEQANKAGENTAEGFNDGINESLKDTDKAGENLGEAAIEGVSKTLEIHSPSEVMKRLGRFTAEGFLIGFEESIETVSQAIINDIMEMFRNGENGILAWKNEINKIVKEKPLKNGLLDIVEGSKDSLLGDLYSTLNKKEKYTDKISLFEETSGQLAFFDGLKEKQEEIQEETKKTNEQIEGQMSLFDTSEAISNIDNLGRKIDEVFAKKILGSTLVDDLGRIITLFHYSANEFDKFDLSKANKNVTLGPGQYFGFDKTKMSDFEGQNKQSQWYAKVKNIFNATSENPTQLQDDQIDKFIESYLTSESEDYINNFRNELKEGGKRAIDAIKKIAQSDTSHDENYYKDMINSLGYDAILGEVTGNYGGKNQTLKELNVLDPSNIFKIEYPKEIDDINSSIQNTKKYIDEIKAIIDETKKELSQNPNDNFLIDTINSWTDNLKLAEQELEQLTNSKNELLKSDPKVTEALSNKSQLFEESSGQLAFFDGLIEKEEELQKVSEETTTQIEGQLSLFDSPTSDQAIITKKNAIEKLREELGLSQKEANEFINTNFEKVGNKFNIPIEKLDELIEKQKEANTNTTDFTLVDTPGTDFTLVDSAEKTSAEVKKEVQAIEEVAPAAEKGAKAKKKMAKANKELAETALVTTSKIGGEIQSMTELATIDVSEGSDAWEKVRKAAEDYGLKLENIISIQRILNTATGEYSYVLRDINGTTFKMNDAFDITSVSEIRNAKKAIEDLSAGYKAAYQAQSKINKGDTGAKVALELNEANKKIADAQERINTFQSLGITLQEETAAVERQRIALEQQLADEIDASNQKQIDAGNKKKQDMIRDLTSRINSDIYTNNNGYKDELQALLDQIDRIDPSDIDKINELSNSFKELWSGDISKDARSGLLNRISSLKSKTIDTIMKNTRMSDSLRSEYESIANTLNQMLSGDMNYTRKQIQDIDNQLKSLDDRMKTTGQSGASMWSRIGNRLTDMNSKLIAQYLSWQDWIRYIRTAITTIRELDTALIDLRKTTTMTTEEMNQFYYDSSRVAQQMGVTTSEIIQQAANWSRLGYSSKEAATQMAALSSQFAQISPGMSVDTATDGLVSSMKAFGYEVDDVERKVMDNINRIGNTMATTNEEIVQMLTRSSAAMAAANNSIEETIALESAAVQVTRNAETTGTALRTISMRIRGYDEETEELSEDYENLSGKIADLTKTASKPGGISLFSDKDKTTYKSTYQLLKDISEIYDELTDKQQAQLLEKLGGKRGGQVIASILNDFSEVERAMSEMSDAAGSSDKEMEIVEQSIDYKLNAIKQSWVGFMQDVLSREDLGKLFDSLLKGSESLQKTLSTLTPVISPLIEALAKLIEKLAEFNESTNGLAGIAGLVYGGVKTKSKIDETRGILGNIIGDGESIDKKGFLDSIKDFFTKNLNEKDVDDATEPIKQKIVRSLSGIELDDFDDDDLSESILKNALKDQVERASEVEDFVENFGDVKDCIEDVSEKVPESTTAFKNLFHVTGEGTGAFGAFAAKIGLSSVALGGIIAVAAAAAVAIYKLYTAQDKINDQIKESYDKYSEAAKSLEDYQNKIIELRNVTDDSTRSVAEQQSAREELLEIQSEMIDKYGLEAGKINTLKDSIDNLNSSFEILNKQSYQEFINNVNKNEGWDGFWNKGSNWFNGYGSNYDSMKDQMENYD